MSNQQDPRTYRDPNYPNTTEECDSPSGMPGLLVPIKTLDGALVWISDEDEQCEFDEKFSSGTGDLMEDVPSILLTIGGQKFALTWAEAYNLGRALIDKTNEAHYG